MREFEMSYEQIEPWLNLLSFMGLAFVVGFVLGVLRAK